MQHSIAIIGLGIKASTFVSGYETAEPVILCPMHDHRLISKHSEAELRELIEERTNEIIVKINDCESAIILSTLGDNTGSILLPTLVKKLSETYKPFTCGVYLTSPIHLTTEEIESTKNDQWKYVKRIANQLDSVFPIQNCGSIVISNYDAHNDKIGENFEESFSFGYFKSETDLFLKGRNSSAEAEESKLIMQKDVTTSAAELIERSVEELIERLNKLWEKRINRKVPFDKYKEECEELIIEIKQRGYCFVDEKIFVAKYLPRLAPNEKRDAQLEKVRQDKQQVVIEKRYEDAARLRDMEKRLEQQIICDYFESNCSDYFFLVKAADKTVMYRLTHYWEMDESLDKVVAID